MSKDWVIFGICWALAIILVWLVPADKRRVGLVAFLFKQAVTWILGLVVVEYGWLSYPIRLFASINKSSFSFEFLFYPMVCAVFNSNFPDRQPLWRQLVYYAMFCTAITVTEVWLESVTNLIRYDEWTWYWTWLTLLLTFVMSRVFTVWFFANEGERREETI